MLKTMKNYIIVLALITAPPVVFSAEAKFHGLKTGMKQSEVIQYLQLDKIMSHMKRNNSITYGDLNAAQLLDALYTGGIMQQYLEEVCKHKDFTSKNFTQVYLDFTQDKVLWRIRVAFRIPIDTLEKIALKKAIEKYFSGHVVKEESLSPSSSYYVVTMVDDKISDMAIQKHIKSFLNEM